ncbi:MAG: glycosyltransferase [Patescibacteria group bacterium]
MKVALIHNLYGIYSRGGAETVVEMMAADFKKAGHEVFLITTKPRKTATDGEKPTDENNGLKIYYLNSKFYNLAELSALPRLFWHLGNIFSFRKYAQIKKILKKEKPDLVVTHNLMGLGFMVPAAIRNLKIKHEHFLHDIQLLHPSGLMLWGQEKKISGLSAKIYRLLTRALFAPPEKIISPSRWLLDLHNQYGFFKNSEKEIQPFAWPEAQTSSNLDQPTMQTAPDPNQPATQTASRSGQPVTQTASDQAGPAESALIKPKQKIKKFLFIGQIEKQKGIFLLIKAFKKISNPDIKLTIAIRGGGASMAAAKEAATGDKRISFIGPLSYEEAEKIKAANDCLIVPSLCYENSPTVIYGARAAGLRVIAANLGGIPEIIGTNDKLFKPGDEADLQRKIMEMIGEV